MLKIGENFKRLRKSLEFNVTEICSEKSKQNKVYKFENSSSSPRIFTVKEILGFLGIQKMSSFFFYCQEDLTFQEVQKVQEKKVSKTAWTYLSKLNQSNAFRYEYSYEDIVIHLSRINEFDENNLADTAIVSPGTVKSFFNEKRVNRSCQILEKICKAFSIELWEFFWIIESLEAIKETRKKEKEKKRSPKLSGTLSLDFGEKKSERETSTSHKKIEKNMNKRTQIMFNLLKKLIRKLINLLEKGTSLLIQLKTLIKMKFLEILLKTIITLTHGRTLEKNLTMQV